MAQIPLFSVCEFPSLRSSPTSDQDISVSTSRHVVANSEAAAKKEERTEPLSWNAPARPPTSRFPTRGSRLAQTARTCLGMLHREVRVSLTPLVVPEKWVFVVGCYNSGTELLMNLLGSHVGIASHPVEGQFLTDQLISDYELGLPRMWVLREDLFHLTESDQGPDPVRLKKEWIMRLDRRKPVFLEKSPPNAARTRWLQHHFDNAHFIALVRNGYAVAEGIRRKAEPFHLREGWPIDLCARQWSRSNEVLLEDSPYLDNLIWVRYEDLVEKPEHELNRMLQFLGLETAPGRSIDVQRQWSVHEKAETIRNMNEESISRLSEGDVQLIRREAETMLRHFGYDAPTSRFSGDSKP